MPKRLPSMFIGSSREGHSVATALQANLRGICEGVVWSQGAFPLGASTLEALEENAPEYDFAALIITPDDYTESRQVHKPSPRDNVIFEAGMFIGILGRKRSFIVFDDSVDLKIPSDLAGIMLAPYSLYQSGNLRASLGPATTQIEEAIRRQGMRGVRMCTRDAPSLKQLHHVSLPVCDLEKSIQFYRDILHLEEIKREKFEFLGAWFSLPSGQELHLILNPKGTFMKRRYDRQGKLIIDPRNCHFALQCRDWKGAQNYFTDLDVPIVVDPLNMNLFQFYILDPDNHVIEINADRNAT